MPSNQKQITEQANFPYSPLGKAFQKQQIDAVTSQNERLSALTNKDYHQDDYENIYKKIFEKTVKERFNEITE